MVIKIYNTDVFDKSVIKRVRYYQEYEKSAVAL